MFISKLVKHQIPVCKHALRSFHQGLIRSLATKAASRGSLEEQNAGSSLQFTPRRTCLYVPGNDEHKFSKCLTYGADCIVLDCEDGVAANKKDEARKLIAKNLQQLKSDTIDHVAVRINSPESGLADYDLSSVFSGEVTPKTIFLPKVEKVSHIDWFTEKLGLAMKSKSKSSNVRLLIYMESAQSLLNLRDIINRSQELSELNFFHLEGIVFGSDDFCASIGASRTKEGKEVIMARQQVVTIAKAYHLQAVDVVYIDYKDSEGLEEDASLGARMGYTGKQAIHPIQVPTIQAAFTPSEERVAWAKELIQLFQEHQKQGQGAFTFRGQMIDKPLLRQAQNILQMVDKMKPKSD